LGIAIESLLFLLGGVILTLVLVKAFGRGSDEAKSRGTVQVKLERAMNASDGIEETRLVLNEQTILVASSAGVRLADYAAEVEQLEAIATTWLRRWVSRSSSRGYPVRAVGRLKRLCRCVGCRATNRTGPRCRYSLF
jgi:hypothetical protein